VSIEGIEENSLTELRAIKKNPGLFPKLEKTLGALY
jgi:hypothetical protein